MRKLLCCACLVLLVGASSVYADMKVVQLLKTPGAEEEDMKLMWSGWYSHINEPLEQVITDEREWASLWEKLFRGRPVPQIDFSRCLVACVFLGTRRTGGYRVEFGSPRLEEGVMIIPYREHKPTGVVTQALTQPFALKVFKKQGSGRIILRREQGNYSPR